ncbi:MAG TPA: hypothetical protein VGI71_06145 [Scandinavium sp.]|jgi:hypothetical protein
MATVKKFFTEQEVNSAKMKLADLPDLSKNRLSRSDVLQSLKDDLIALVQSKGYSAADIKSVLEGMELSFSEKAIADVIREAKGKTGKKASSARKAVKNVPSENSAA